MSLVFLIILSGLDSLTTEGSNPFASLMTDLDRNVTNHFQVAIKRLDSTLFVNDRHASATFKRKCLNLKEKIMIDLRADFLQITGDVSHEEPRVHQLRVRWDRRIQHDLQEWHDRELFPWIEQIKGIWHGVKERVRKRLRTLRHRLDLQSHPRHYSRYFVFLFTISRSLSTFKNRAQHAIDEFKEISYNVSEIIILTLALPFVTVMDVCILAYHWMVDRYYKGTL